MSLDAKFNNFKTKYDLGDEAMAEMFYKLGVTEKYAEVCRDSNPSQTAINHLKEHGGQSMTISYDERDIRPHLFS